jgi:hypothetical protein
MASSGGGPVIGSLILCAYVVIGLITARKVAYAILLSDSDQHGKVDGGDRWFAALTGIATGVVWPATLAVMLFATSIPKTPAELKAQAKEAEARARAAEEIVWQFAAEHGEPGKRGIIVSGDDRWPF